MASSPISTASPTPAWRQKLEAFWRWWTGELAQMVPERFAALGGATRVPQVAVEGDRLLLVEPKAPGVPQDSVVIAQDPQTARDAVRKMLERAGEARGRARLVLAKNEALVRRAAMPAATEENLAQVISFEMDRLTPFRADEVYFDHRIVGRDAAAATLVVLVAVARRDIVDGRVELLRSLGVTVEGVGVQEDAAQGAALNLMPPELRGQRETERERLMKLALLAAAGVLLLAVLLYPPYAKREVIKSLHPVEAKAQSEAQATSKLAQELERLVGEHNFLLAKKHGTPPALAYIEEISRLLPDNTWVQQLELKVAGKVRELQITGETASSSKLIEILEQSTLLKNATPRGTVTRGSQPGTERFAIAAETTGRPQPETIPVSQLPTPVAAAPSKTERPKAAPPPPPAAPPTPAKVEPVKPSAPAQAGPPFPTTKPPSAPAPAGPPFPTSRRPPAPDGQAGPAK
ncbi:MAG TPA: pilus assembly protein PilM [Usitatibacter sp.]|nr:pilus assembly protein PilM [Usitatibacter sp.]